MLSSRALKNVQQLERPFRFTPTPDYDPQINPQGLISFGMAENRPMRSEIVKYINEKVTFTLDSVSYRSSATINSRLPGIAAAHLDKVLSTHSPINPDHVFVADSPTSLGNMLGFNLAERGEGIIVNRPVYGRFELDYGVEAGVEIVYADTATDEAFTPNSVAKYEQALIEAEKRGIKIRAVLIVNPHNPVGRCYPSDTLRHIARFCDRNSLHLISDEVYASCVFDSGDPDSVPFNSILSLNLQGLIDPNLVHVLYGFSKDFASGGLHLGFLVTANEQLRKACKMVLRLHGASQAAITIGTAILEDQVFVQGFLAKSQASLAAGYRLVTSTLREAGINYMKGGNAGFFIYVDLSPFLPDINCSVQEREFALAQRLLDEGIFLHPGEEHSKDAGWFRLVFSNDEPALKEGLRR
ncbi:hypothetical protein N7509_006776 [Penicillium cosmopolitanum]|uniref:Aminotransferase class I/classII large domain-containing protein n=1 Tax=Penicillium cosmopolitanum TaxID=1131564 RepID=A0A9W9VXX0_9EURO|nr:uncharacterized protein N7509_006776 [Penicillium cosmopolitanum]KAJ5391286.1 hypothetical protein N7509_006776 [Penicillium cosmopolitanum]